MTIPTNNSRALIPRHVGTRSLATIANAPHFRVTCEPPARSKVLKKTVDTTHATARAPIAMRSCARRHRASSASVPTKVMAFALLSSRLSRAVATSSAACAALGYHEGCTAADCELLRARTSDDRMADECASCCASSSAASAASTAYASARVQMCK